MKLHPGLFIPLLLLCHPAQAAVRSVTPQGFAVEETATVHAPPARAYEALRDIGHWWSGQHSFSGNALNLRLDLTPGGCFCETLPAGGGVRHMQVVFASPGRAVIMTGALGPLLDQGVSATMQIEFAPATHGTTITLGYTVGGYMPKGAAFWAPSVDGVLAQQLQRLARFIDTGNPEPPAPHH